MDSAVSRPARNKTRPTTFFACIGKYRTCARAALPGRLLCEECNPLDGMVNIEKPFRVLVRAHFSGNSKYGQTIVRLLENEGVRVVRRTKERQLALEGHRKLLHGGIMVFGESLRPLVTVEDAVKEMENEEGYRLRDLHILDFDEVLEGTDREEETGRRTVVFNYEYAPTETSLVLSEYALELTTRPFVGCRVYVNLRDPVTGAMVHCAELISLQIKQEPRIRLKFARSVWGFEDITDYSRKTVDSGESDRDKLLREINEFQADMQAKTRTW